MKDDFLSAEWAEHHHTFTDGFFDLLKSVFGWLRRPRAAAKNGQEPQ